MTALVVIRAGNLNRTITDPVRRGRLRAASTTPATRACVPGDKLTARQLLYGLLLPSGADAAYALAEAYGPGLPGVHHQDERHRQALGMTRTHFSNFDGLPWPTEYSTYSTAADLLTLGRAAMTSLRSSARSWTSAATGSPPAPAITPTCGATSIRCSATTPARSASRPATPRAAGPLPAVRGHQERPLPHRRHPGQPRHRHHRQRGRRHPHPELGLQPPRRAAHRQSLVGHLRGWQKRLAIRHCCHRRASSDWDTCARC